MNLHTINSCLAVLCAATKVTAGLISHMGAANRCAYAAELGRMPSIYDIRLLGLDEKSLSGIFKA